MAPHLVFGAGSIGTTSNSYTFTWDNPQKILEPWQVLKRLDILELDSAASYPPTNPWNAETLMGQSNTAENGFIIDSKIASHGTGPKLDDKGISSSTERTLGLLGINKLRTMYAHAPDNQTPMEETAAAFDKQFRDGEV